MFQFFKCLCGAQDNHGGDFAFEIFAHVTRFFGYKVIELFEYFIIIEFYCTSLP
jgi:hypothetical protein